MDWFYNKKLSLMCESGGYLYHGSWIDGTLTEVKSITCDVQPGNRELIYKEYGYYIDCTYRVFCDVDNDIKEGSIVKYGKNQFKVMKIVPWDDYYDVFIQS
ncbi:MAG: hypothetical protein VB078_10805 [Clostridiaceae bacterium]|nr:hypothetical protein [Clostridiaceae bacterium]